MLRRPPTSPLFPYTTLFRSGHSSAVNADYVKLSMESELRDHRARTVLGKDLLDQSINLAVSNILYSHRIGLLQSAESTSKLPDPAWTAEMVRLTSLVRSATTPEVIKMRQELMVEIRALLPKHPEWKAQIGR